MSRWIENFKNHAFQREWKKLKEQSENLTANDETVATAVEEIARLKKVIAFLDELLEAVDAELVPLNIWKQFNDQIIACLNQINTYIQNKDIGHINNANGNLDNLLSYLKPYVVNSKGSAVAAGRAYNEYSKAINDHLRIVEDKVKSILTQTVQNKAKTDGVLLEIEESKNNIKKLETDFLTGEEGNPSLKQKMEGLFSEASTWYSKIKDFHQKLTSGSEQESAIILQVEEAKKKAAADSKEAHEAKESLANLLADLGKFYITVFGAEKENGEREGGLKQELKHREDELEAFKLKHEETYGVLHKEIETLLPGATSAGLATAYRELKESF